jgi:orotate phosphoribosyltransferase-like protein
MQHSTETIVSQYKASGLTQKEFCNSKSISLNTLQYHLKKSRKTAKPALPAFLPVSQQSSSAMRVIIIDGACISDLPKMLSALGN